MGAEHIGPAQRGQHGEKRLGTTHLVAEILKGMRQRVADWKSQRPQPERVQENRHLVLYAHRAVLQIAVIKAEAGIENDFFHVVALCDFNLPGKIFTHHLNRVGAEIEIVHFADVFALHVTKNHRRVVIRNHAEQLIAAVRACEVQNVRARLKARARDGG